jgi:hypothetical protein
MGKGISLDRFREFMTCAHKMLALEIASVSPQQKTMLQQDYLQTLVHAAQT